MDSIALSPRDPPPSYVYPVLVKNISIPIFTFFLIIYLVILSFIFIIKRKQKDAFKSFKKGLAQSLLVYFALLALVWLARFLLTLPKIKDWVDRNYNLETINLQDKYPNEIVNP